MTLTCPFCNIEMTETSLALHIAISTDDRHHRNNLAMEIQKLLEEKEEMMFNTY